MKNIKKFVLGMVVVLFLTALTPMYSFAQGNGNGNNGNGNGNGNNGNGNGGGNNGGGATVPINSGLIVLLVAGVAVGAYALYKKNTKVLAKSNKV